VLFTAYSSGEKILPSSEIARSEKDGLYPLEALVQLLALRFKYHFDGTRETNRLDKVMCSLVFIQRNFFNPLFPSLSGILRMS